MAICTGTPPDYRRLYEEERKKNQELLDRIEGLELTLRDEFAMVASHEDLPIPERTYEAAAKLGIPVEEYDAKVHWPRLVARLRYEAADAMMEERLK
jgi:hypothetical protein